MTSTIKVDTISEKTSANGVSIDGLTIKDGNITATTSDADILVKGNDGGSEITALTFDMSDAGAATFNNNVVVNDRVQGASNLVLNTVDSNEKIHLDASGFIKFESNGVERMRIFSAGNVSIGTTDDHAKLTVMSASCGGGANSDADELQLEGSGNAGMTIASGTSSSGNIHFADVGAANRGIFSYDHSADSMKFGTAGTVKARFTSGGALSLNDSSPDVDTGGLTLNHGANDAAVLTLKNSDVAHPYTGIAEADTYARFSKNSVNNGGLFVQGYSDSSTTAIQFRACGTDGDQTKSGAATGYFSIEAAKTDGSASVASPGSNENLVTIRSGTDDCVFIFDEEGTLHSDTSNTTFDEYEDAQLVRAYDLSHGRGVISSKFDKFVGYNLEKLAELKLVGRDADGSPNHMVNWMGISQLHNGAIWQQYEKHQKLAEAVYEMAKETLGADKADAILKKHDIKLLN